MSDSDHSGEERCSRHPIYRCKRCGSEFSSKRNLRSHYERKVICEVHVLDVSREDLIKAYDDYEAHKQKIPKHCATCFKFFNNRQGLNKHIPCKSYNSVNDENRTQIEQAKKVRHQLIVDLFGEPNEIISFGENFLRSEVVEELGHDYMYERLISRDVIGLAVDLFMGSVERFKNVRFNGAESDLSKQFMVCKNGYWVHERKAEVLDYVYETSMLALRQFWLFHPSVFHTVRENLRLRNFLEDEDNIEEVRRIKTYIMRYFMEQDATLKEEMVTENYDAYALRIDM